MAPLGFGPVDSVQGNIDGSRTLFLAKLSPPELPIGHLPRGGLLEAVQRGGGSRIAAVTAPAGYGKTTLLAEWAALERRGIGWVSLDEGDNDPVKLVFALAAAFGPTQGLPSAFWESMSGPGGSALGRLGPRLAATMAWARSPFVLMVDDLHAVTSPTCHDVIDLLVSAVPEGSALVLAGRVEPPNFPSWRVTTSVVEIGAEQLAFDTNEAARFFRLAEVRMSEQQVLDLHHQLEGWVAGLQLALIAARRSPIDITRHDRHARAIYRKLGAQSRAEAVDRAIALGLLGDFAGTTTP